MENAHDKKQEGHEEQGLGPLMKKNPLLVDALFVLLLAAAVGGFLYWQDMDGKIYIEKAEITSPVISLGPAAMGEIEKFYVSEGDDVSTGQKLAMVGDQLITAKTSGTIIWLQNTPGQTVSPSQPVIRMINPREFRVTGRVQEDKGLADIKPGQKVMFMVDAFPEKTYEGVVESVGESARQSDIMFSISDKREEREFDVRAIFDVKQYSELKNGMSAKMWIYK
jgi:multidrug resistance efflux pump